MLVQYLEDTKLGNGKWKPNKLMNSNDVSK